MCYDVVLAVYYGNEVIGGSWTDAHGQFGCCLEVALDDEVFLLGLSAGELVVYSFLKRCENRKTHQCWPSIKTI